ncbi:hypothetical protein CPU12_05455 [Malaciobacter molluscorum LMG 25693]|uniref:Acetyltransferase n=1 Tax=Malaciobacter molluscorum LMG 25693 TaxID=870501 RepID=A0A2G1DIV4_9BACT|nr:arylamine N-acetyltransferase [Malaciobacter molluscorum]AXX93184.1 acetyltransferase [Malaciobacter molluscorum LMG 25693]PHO18439.1 hypothetical protein CPU12_05455 [Malaciobacter molluscorum LMG 25693]
MEIEKILKRIEIFDKPSKINISLDNLTKLQEAYILNVPYENLDFVFKKEFSVNILKIYEKIVCNYRGGICYESNTLFMYLLKNLGFDVQMIFAKVEDITYIGADYPHLALLVTIDNKQYLVDVANGQNVRVPLCLNEDKIVKSEDIEYKLKKINEEEFALMFNHKYKGWQTRYIFTKEKKSVSDFSGIFENTKNYKQFSNYAPLLVTKALENGRVTLTDDTMTYKKDDHKRVWEISLENRAEVLRDYFNIEI